MARERYRSANRAGHKVWRASGEAFRGNAGLRQPTLQVTGYGVGGLHPPARPVSRVTNILQNEAFFRK